MWIRGQYCDDLRDYTHQRLVAPGSCDCYNCKAKEYEFDKQEEIWERKIMIYTEHYDISALWSINTDDAYEF